MSDLSFRRLIYIRDLNSRAQGGKFHHDLCFDLYSCETHAVLSTSTYHQRSFCDLLCGNILSYSGTFEVLKKPVLANHQLEKSIQVIGLEPAIFPSLSIVENISICNLKPRWFVQPKALNHALDLMRQLDISLDVTKPTSALTQDESRIVELLRICSICPPIVIFYDMCNYISSESRPLLSRVLQWLKQHGSGIVYLSANLEDAFEMGDRVSILDSGTIRATFQADAKDIQRNASEIARLLTGWEPLASQQSDSEQSSVQETMSNIDKIVQSSNELKRMLSYIIKELIQMLNADGAMLYLIDESRMNVIDNISSWEDPASIPVLHQADVLYLLQQNKEQFFQKGTVSYTQLFSNNSQASTIFCFPILLNGKQSALIQIMFLQHCESSSQISAAIAMFAREISMAIETSQLLGNSVLLHETHHRIKNNLQMVHNLLYLQKEDARSGKPVDTLQVLDTAMQRIKCVATVHSLLCRDWYGYNVVSLKDLLCEILEMYRGLGIDLVTELKDISVPYNDAISLALVANELVSNCVRHAFPSKPSDAQIRISLSSIDHEILLSVCDNGIGLPVDIDLSAPESVGMSIVQSIVTDLRGTIQYCTVDPHGTRVTIRFSRQNIHSPVSFENSHKI